MKDKYISKNQLLEALNREWHFRYYLYPEGELLEDYPKRCLRGEGFLNAIRLVKGVKKKKTKKVVSKRESAKNKK